jgi:hypothetical protein
MKNILSALKSALLIVGVAVSLSCFAFPAEATSNSPTLTAEQQKYKTAIHQCVQKFEKDKIPESQHHTYMSACMKAKGFPKAVHFPHSLPPPPAPSKQ